jgi:DNA invertase Pin-like site-specific DNA recombinase
MKKRNNDYNFSNIINYVRKSRQDLDKERRTGEDTLAEQTKLMQRVLNDMGIPYVQKFEVGSGDKISTRPVFQEVLEDLKNSLYDAIAVKEISRLGRGSMTDMGSIYDLLIDKRIYIITPSRIYDPRNPSDSRQIRFEMFFAREEFEQIRERLTGARYSSAMEGKWMGSIPFGYNRDNKTMRLIPNEDESGTVRLIYNLYINGFEGKEVREKAISTILKRLGILSPKGSKYWDTTQIKRILTNDAYIGVSKYRTTEKTLDGKVVKRPEDEHIIVQDAHQKIIDITQFNKVQEKMQTKANSRTKFDLDIYELTALLTCGVCSRKLVVNRYNRKRRSGSSYIDMYVRCRNGCCTVKYEFVEEKIIGLLKHLLKIDEKLLFEMYESTKESSSNNSTNLTVQDELKKSLEKKKIELHNRLKFIQDKHFIGIYTDEDYIKFKNEIDKEFDDIKKLETNNSFLEVSASIETIDIATFRTKIDSILSAYNELDNPSKKNELLRRTFDEIVLEVIEKGSKQKSTKIKLMPTLALKMWNMK